MNERESGLMPAFLRETDSLVMSTLAVMLVSPDPMRRETLAKALTDQQAKIVRELTHYPEVDDVAGIVEEDADVIVVDLDPNPEQALDVVENLCGQASSATVMVYAGHAEPELLMQCMRAGAREFLRDPLLPGSVAEALVRASVRREELQRQRRRAGRLLVFAGAKGGSGVTTVATNFAVALATQTKDKVALVDLDFQLGDAALNLGVPIKFTVVDALENANRIDSDFLSGLMAKHSSGLSVLGAPDSIPDVEPQCGGVDRLLRLVRQDYAYVIVDAGAHSIELYETLFRLASTVYLISQVSIAELRNANRFISRYFSGPDRGKLEVVLNRFVPRGLEIDDAAIMRALTQPVKWKIPNDFSGLRRAQTAGTSVVLEKSALARSLMEMASAAGGLSAVSDKKRKYSLFG